MSAEQPGWSNVGAVHTVPVEDTYPHALSPHCACQPTHNHDADVLLVVHNAFDGRDFEKHRAKLAPLREET